MKDPIRNLIADRGWLLADGATGTTLFNMGLAAGDAPEFWNRDAPDRVRTLYGGAVAAGCDLFLTNSFGSNAARLRLHGAADQAFELSRMAAALGRDVAGSAGRPVLVAGSMGPTGEIMAPMGSLTHADAVEIFHEQAEGLKAGGADLLWVETISSREEFAAASEAAAKAGMPWCGTMSFDTAGHTMMGVTAGDLVALVDRLDHPPIAFGANCGVGASDLLRTVLGMAAHGPQRPLIAKGNAGIPKYVDGHVHYDGTPDLMADYATLARDCGATLIGGCCGTTPEHLRRMRRALSDTAPGPRPSLDDIATRLGGFSSPDDGSTPSPRPARIRRRTRRA